MSLIKCPECGKEISDEAKVCPNCGKPMVTSKEIKPINKLAIIIPCVVVIGIIIGIIMYVNSPSYIVKQYVKAINEKDYDKKESFEYDYEIYDIYNYCDIEDVKVKEYEFIEKGNDPDFIYEYTTKLYQNNNPSDSNISYIYVYIVRYKTFMPKSNILVLGKVHNKIKVVSSPFYDIE